MISKYDDDSKFGHNEQRDSSLVAHLNRLSRLVKIIGEFTTCDQSDLASIFNRGSAIQHTAMCFLHTELRGLLNPTLKRYSTSSFTAPATPHSPSSSTSSSNQHQEAVEQSTMDDDDFPGYHPQDIYNMSKIAGSMISSGYQIECCLVYGSIRRTALNIKLERLGHVNISAEDINKMDWETLEGEIASMIDIIKRCSSSLFSAERNLCNAVFVNNPSIYRDVFTDLASTVMDRFFNFAQTITLTKCSAEKLFKFLDLYETLRDLGPEIENLSSSKSSASSSTSVKTEIYETVIQIGQAAVSMFCDLENSIKRDNSRTTVPSGAVHPLTRYTMNYLKYACEYKDALEQVFLQRQKTKGATSSSEQSTSDEKHADGANEDGTPKTSPFSIELNMVMDLLDENLETKSNLYRDHALRHIFMMNNGRYILQKIKSSPEIHDMMGATWCRRRSSDLRKYHKGYTRETWGRVLQCLRHEGLQVNGKMAKALLKERFKMFNNTIEEIHKTQSTWVVSDEQLQSEIRVSVSAVVIPAYRSFLGRFQQYLTHGRQTEKYIKYQPEDIENFIEGLFDGNPTAMARKRS
ncbi:Exocyst complex component EXO70B1 [Linum perenne]